MLKLGRVTKVKVLFLVLVFVFNFDLFKFSAAILEKGLFDASQSNIRLIQSNIRLKIETRSLKNLKPRFFNSFALTKT